MHFLKQESLVKTLGAIRDCTILKNKHISPCQYGLFLTCGRKMKRVRHVHILLYTVRNGAGFKNKLMGVMVYF